MTRRKRARPNAMTNYAFQTTKYEILAEAERQNVAEVWLLKTEWELMWRMCGKLPIEQMPEGDDSFVFESRRYVKKDHPKPPEGVLDLTTDDDEE
jgi:hypothetical protein